MDLWPLTINARESLISTLDGIEEDRWDVPSLCDGWTIRDVLAHLILAARPPAKRYGVAVLKARGDFGKANYVLAVTDGLQRPDQLLARYRTAARHRFSPPGWPAAAPLSDILLHSLDVRIPLGIECNVPPDHYEPVLDLLFRSIGRTFTSNGRPKLRWVASDHDWSHGSGAEVRGTMEDLALTAAGRRARVDHLQGPGLAELRGWLD